MKHLFKIINLVLILLLISSVFLLVVFTFSPFRTLTLLNVMSGSMEPAINTGSVIFVSKVDPKSLQLNDIINFSLPDNASTFTHRIIQINSTNANLSFIVKGDANNSPDLSPVESTQINGKVIFAIPFLGHLYTWIKQPLGFILWVIIPAVLIIISEIISIKKTIEQEVTARLEKKYASKISTPLVILLLLILPAFFVSGNSHAYFSSAKVLSDTTFSTAKWDNDPPPKCHRPDDWFTIHFDKKHHRIKIKFKFCDGRPPIFHYIYIRYFAHHQLQEIIRTSPQISSQEIEEYLGTCSSGDCIPDYDPSSQAEVTLDSPASTQYIDLK